MDIELETLISQISEYEYELHKNEKNLMRVKGFFANKELWPDQCNYAVQVLVELNTAVRKLNRLLDLYLSYPRETDLNRYTILVEFHYLDKEIGELGTQIGQYREICQSNEESRSREYNRIVSRLEKTWKYYQSYKETLETIICTEELHATAG